MNPTDRPESAGRDTPEAGAAPSSAGISRRRLFKGAAAGTGVLLTVHARTALGGAVCESPSQAFSGNLSRPDGNSAACSGGLSPGYWVQPQHFGAWRAAGVEPPRFNGEVIDCTSGVGSLKKLELSDLSGGTSFSSVFGVQPKLTDGTAVDAPLWALMGMKDEFVNPHNLMYHIVAAYLNSKYFTGTPQYAITTDQVIAMFNAVVAGGTYAPPNATNSASWGTADVAAYISGMYDINATVPNYCTSKNSNG